jgi:hypothetical protein
VNALDGALADGSTPAGSRAIVVHDPDNTVLKGTQPMAANATDPATRGIAKYLSEHPGLHDLDTIAQAASASKPIAGKVLKQLLDTTPPVIRAEGTGATKKWAWALPSASSGTDEPKNGTAIKTDNADKKEEAKSDQHEAAPASTTKAPEPKPSAEPSGTGPRDPAASPAKADVPAAPARDADQTIMHAARTLAAAKEPVTTADIAAAGYLAPKSLHLLTALRALAAGGLIDCSKPFSPDDPDCTWQWTGTDPATFLSAAAKVELEDAPDSATCPTCGTVKTIPGIAKNRNRGGNVRGDGKPRLGKDELGDMVKAWVAAPENAGELVKVGDVERELRAVHGAKIAKHSYGSVSKALAKLTEFDPARKDQPALLTLESDKPVTYRIRDLPKR